MLSKAAFSRKASCLSFLHPGLVSGLLLKHSGAAIQYGNSCPPPTICENTSDTRHIPNEMHSPQNCSINWFLKVHNWCHVAKVGPLYIRTYVPDAIYKAGLWGSGGWDGKSVNIPLRYQELFVILIELVQETIKQLTYYQLYAIRAHQLDKWSGNGGFVNTRWEAKGWNGGKVT